MGKQKMKSLPSRNAEEDKKPGENCNIHPLQAFRMMESQISFGELSEGGRFQFVPTETSPRNETCPVHVKLALSRVDENNPQSNLFNCQCTKTGWIGWIPDMVVVMPMN